MCNKTRGLTILELTMAATIGLLAMSLAMLAYNNLQRNQIKNDVIVDTQLNVQFTQNELQKIIQQACVGLPKNLSCIEAASPGWVIITNPGTGYAVSSGLPTYSGPNQALITFSIPEPDMFTTTNRAICIYDGKFSEVQIIDRDSSGNWIEVNGDYTKFNFSSIPYVFPIKKTHFYADTLKRFYLVDGVNQTAIQKDSLYLAEGVDFDLRFRSKSDTNFVSIPPPGNQLKWIEIKVTGSSTNPRFPHTIQTTSRTAYRGAM